MRISLSDYIMFAPSFWGHVRESLEWLPIKARWLRGVPLSPPALGTYVEGKGTIIEVARYPLFYRVSYRTESGYEYDTAEELQRYPLPWQK